MSVTIPIRDVETPQTVSTTRLLLGLSAVSTGLDQIERGQIEEGKNTARHGLEFMRKLLGVEQ